MATKMKRLTLHLRTFILLIWMSSEGDGYSCPYGQICQFLPAPPGRTPPCAQPGLTYCLDPDPYPEQLIRQLVQTGSYDIRTLLSDESRDDFNARSDYPYGYGPNSLPNVDEISLTNDFYEKDYKFNRFNQDNDIYSQKTPLQPPSTLDPSPYNIKAYQASNFSKFGFQGYQTSPGSYWNQNQYSGYDKKVYRPSGYTQNVFAPSYYTGFNSNDWVRQASGVTQYNPADWWKYLSPSRSDVSVSRSYPARRARRRRNAELVKAASKRTLSGAEALRIALGLASAETSAERSKRQNPNVEELCRVRTRFESPRAALNNQGSWRYLVNMSEGPNMTQLVKTEVCDSTECSGLCSVPLGYSSRCEQRYVQKRLVALQTDGRRLYTDIFWIPSCCQCTIINNN